MFRIRAMQSLKNGVVRNKLLLAAGVRAKNNIVDINNCDRIESRTGITVSWSDRREA